MADVRVIPGEREVRATLSDQGTDSIVVACPPHPQYGGSRHDPRLQALDTALADVDVACLRIDYGPWAQGQGEATDVVNTVVWASDRYGSVGLFGYSFGAGIALRVAADREALCAVSVLAPPETSSEPGDVTAAVGGVRAPLQVIVGERDNTVEWEPVADATTKAGGVVERVQGDHHFVGQSDEVAKTATTFLADRCDG